MATTHNVRGRTPVTAPPAQPPRYGLIAAAPELGGPLAEWANGFRFLPEQCAGGGREAITCLGDTSLIEPDENPDEVTGDPFVVWAGDECRTVGYQSRNLEGRARRLLAAIESYEIANELWTGTLRDSTTAGTYPMSNRALADVAADTLTDGPTAEVAALGCIEYGLGVALRGARGMVHTSTQVLTHLAAEGAIHRDANLWLTPTGNLVVADAGYDGSGPNGELAGASQWIYGTEMIALRLGPVEVVPADIGQALDRSVDRLRYLAQRVVAYMWPACCHLAAEVDVGVCLTGGLS